MEPLTPEEQAVLAKVIANPADYPTYTPTVAALIQSTLHGAGLDDSEQLARTVWHDLREYGRKVTAEPDLAAILLTDGGKWIGVTVEPKPKPKWWWPF